MTTVTISPKYQIVLPLDVRTTLDLRPGQKVEVLVHDGRIEVVPVQPIRDLRGLLKGAPPFERDPADRLA